MKNVKTLVSGILIGVIITSAVTVFAEVIEKIEAYRVQTKITLDGKELSLPSDTDVLNYENRTYTPARFIAESLGATVEWDATNDTVKITSPNPTVIEKEVIKEVEKEVIKEVAAEREYLSLPVRYATKDFYVEVYGAQVFSNRIELLIKVKNESDYNLGLEFLEHKAYIEYNGEKMQADSSTQWIDTLFQKSEKEGTLVFSNVRITGNKAAVTIPIDVVSYPDLEKTSHTIKFYMDLTEKD